MKHAGKKGLSVLLSLCMIVSLFAGLTVTAAAAELPSEGGTLAAGEYELTDNVKLTSNLIINGVEVTIDLAGHTLIGTGGSVITVQNGGTLVLKDSGEDGAVTGGDVGVRVDSGGSFTMTGGIIAGSTGDNGAGVGVYVDGSSGTATFTMTGGTIRNNPGNGLTVKGSHATATIGAAAVIRKNTNTNCGGGVLVQDGGTVTMNGGKIVENSANMDGGGVYISSGGTFTLNDGEIGGNTAGSGGGGVYVNSGEVDGGTNGTFIMTGGTIKNNTAEAAVGGGVSVASSDNELLDGVFQMTGGSIVDNTANTYGGGVFMGGTFQVSGAPQIIDNQLSDGTRSNVTLQEDSDLWEHRVITDTGLTDGAEIGVSLWTLPKDDETVTVLTSSGVPNADWLISDVEGYVIEPSGNTLVLKVNDVPEDGLTRAQLAVLVCKQFDLTDTGTGNYFNDISDCDTTEQNAINALAAAEIVWGSADGTFSPYDAATRRTAAVILARALGCNTEDVFAYLQDQGVLTPNEAEDLTANADAPATEDEIRTWFSRLGGDTPVPVDGLTRADLAVLVYNKFQPESIGAAPGFTDIADCTPAQQKAINAVAAAGILRGTMEGNFEPDKTATYGQAAIVLQRAASGDADAYDIPAAIEFLVRQGLLTSGEAAALDPNAPAAEDVVASWFSRTEPYIITFDSQVSYLVASPKTIRTVNGRLPYFPNVFQDTTPHYTTIVAPTGTPWVNSSQRRLDGWYTKPSGGTLVTTDTVFTQDTTVYAHWSIVDTNDDDDDNNSGGNSSSGTTTTTTKNPDGSTTTTKTDKSTGTVTETTKYPDGSTTTVETTKDGTVTTTETSADGTITKTVETPDGSVEVTVELADGTTVCVNVGKDDKIEVEVRPSLETVSAASDSGEAVTLPISPVTASTSSDSAPVISVVTPGKEVFPVEIPVEDVTPGTVAVVVNPDGSETVVKKSVVTEDGVALIIDGDTTVKVIDNAKTFSDVSTSYWGSDAVDFVSARGLFNGTTPDTFAPDTAMSRGMLAVVLHNLEDNPGHALEGTFADVSDGDWYADGIHWAAGMGIVGGYGDGSFGANDPITREDMAVILYRYASVTGYDVTSSASLSGFADADSVSGYAADAMRWAVGAGLIGGMDDGTLAPKGNATRAEVATILMRFCAGLV